MSPRSFLIRSPADFGPLQRSLELNDRACRHAEIPRMPADKRVYRRRGNKRISQVVDGLDELWLPDIAQGKSRLRGN